ncbi:MAG: class I SAM-dependent RNA methyltransferase [Pseudomonadota bacterium]
MMTRQRAPRLRGGKRGRQTKRDPLIGTETDATIAEIGGRGDGIAHVTLADGKEIIAYTDHVLPGDHVRLRLTQRRGDGYGANVVAVHNRPNPHAAAHCSHYEKCGGCALQHLPDADYRAWKRSRALQAVMRAGIADLEQAEKLVGELAVSAPATRRRAGFSVHCGQTGVSVGFAERYSHHVVDLQDCAVLHPALMVFRGALQAFLSACEPAAAKQVSEAFVTLCENGLDVVLSASGEPDLTLRQGLAELAEQQDLARLSWKIGNGLPEPVAMRRTPQVHFSGIAVSLPAGGFLQATQDGETALTTAISNALRDIPARHVIDLFSGIGSFTFTLALAGDRRRVMAVESDLAAVRNLQSAAGQSKATIDVLQRDLFRRPLNADDFKGVDLMLFDPPRAGAQAQCEILAVSGPEWIIAVSCNPATFSRDIKELRDGGYELSQVIPVDQFLWSPHLELFAVLHRTRKAA